jgi:hypothetical protein
MHSLRCCVRTWTRALEADMKRCTAALTIVLSLLLVCTIALTTHAQTARSTLTLDNQSGQSALVKLIGLAGRLVAVPNSEKRAVTIGAGKYYLLARYGSDPCRYTYSRGDPFTVEETATQYAVITITLHPVVGGNYHTRQTSAQEFDSAQVAPSVPGSQDSSMR